MRLNVNLKLEKITAKKYTKQLRHRNAAEAKRTVKATDTTKGNFT